MSEEKNMEDQINAIVSEIKTKLEDKNFSFKEQRELIQKISDFKTWQIITPLEDLIDYEKSNANIKQKALEALGQLGDPRVIKILAKFSTSDDKVLKNAAIKGLSLIENAKCVPPLLDVLNDEDKWIKIFAIHGLYKNFSKKVAKPIIDKMGDEDPEVRQEAIAALTRSDSDLFEEELLEAFDSENRFLKLGAVALAGDKEIIQSSKKLIELLDSPDRRLVLIASRSLSKIGDPNSIPELLVRALKGEGMDSIFVTSILNIGDLAIVPLIRLYVIAQEKDLKDLILDILKKFGNDVLEEILAVQDETEDESQKKELDILYKKF